MKKNLAEVYALAVCFASLIVLLVSAAMTSYELVRIAFPRATVRDHVYERTRSNELYLRSWPQNQPVPSPSEVERLRQELWDHTLQTERHDGLRSFLQQVMYALAAAVAFALHWRLWRRERLKSIACAIA
jgi:hypothetical protein